MAWEQRPAAPGFYHVILADGRHTVGEVHSLDCERGGEVGRGEVQLVGRGPSVAVDDIRWFQALELPGPPPSEQG
jgi:hypothetical protein